MKIKKSLLIMPTTDHTTLSFIMSYEELKDKYDIYFILDGHHIKNEYNICWAKQIPVSAIKDFSYYRGIFKSIPIFINSLYLKSKLVESFNLYRFDALIVSNDCPMLQDLAIQVAKKNHVPVVTHQLASGIIPDKKGKQSVSERIKYNLIKFISRTNKNNGYGGKSDYVILMGDMWRSIVSPSIVNENVRVISNGFYYYFKKDFISRTKELDRIKIKSSHDIDLDKKCVVFCSQPFFEIGLFNMEHTKIIYEQVNELSLKYSDKFQFCFKPHPQEHLYKEFKFSKDIILISDLTPDESLKIADATLSVSSSMSLQARLLGIRSYSLEANVIPQKYKTQSQYFFDSPFSIKEPITEESSSLASQLNDVIDIERPPHADLIEFFDEVING